MGGALAGFGAGRDAASAEITPCVYDERPRLPVGLAVGAADQAPRACDSARGLTGKERAISRFVAPGPRVRILLPPAESLVKPDFLHFMPRKSGAWPTAVATLRSN